VRATLLALAVSLPVVAHADSAAGIAVTVGSVGDQLITMPEAVGRVDIGGRLEAFGRITVVRRDTDMASVDGPESHTSLAPLLLGLRRTLGCGPLSGGVTVSVSLPNRELGGRAAFDLTTAALLVEDDTRVLPLGTTRLGGDLAYERGRWFAGGLVEVAVTGQVERVNLFARVGVPGGARGGPNFAVIADASSRLFIASLVCPDCAGFDGSDGPEAPDVGAGLSWASRGWFASLRGLVAIDRDAVGVAVETLRRF